MAVGISAFKRLKQIFGKEVTLQTMTQTYNDTTGDMVDTVSSSQQITVIFDMDNDTSLERDDGRHTLGVNKVYVDGDITITKMDRLVDGSTTYQIEDIRSGVRLGNTVYQACIVNRLV